MESSPTNLLTRWWLVEPNPFIKIWQPSNWIISPENWGWKLQKYCQKPQPLNKPNNQGPGVHFLFIAPTHLGPETQISELMRPRDRAEGHQWTLGQSCPGTFPTPWGTHITSLDGELEMEFDGVVWWFVDKQSEVELSWGGSFFSSKFSLVSCDWGNYISVLLKNKICGVVVLLFFFTKKGEKENVQRQRPKKNTNFSVRSNGSTEKTDFFQSPKCMHQLFHGSSVKL